MFLAICYYRESDLELTETVVNADHIISLRREPFVLPYGIDKDAAELSLSNGLFYRLTGESTNRLIRQLDVHFGKDRK